MLYQTDYNLVYNVLGTRKANKVGTTTATSYWMASRYYSYNSSTYWEFNGRYMNTSGSSSKYYLYYYGSDFYDESVNYALRPIVTLDSELQYEGLGTEWYPMEIKG